MKKFVAGLVIGFLLATAFGVTASSNIRLIINGNEVETDVPPQLIDGRVMVPARFIAEPLGATVEWDSENSIVRVNKVAGERLPNEPYPGNVIIDGKEYPADPSRRPPTDEAIKQEAELMKEPEITVLPLTTIPVNYQEEYIGNTIEIADIKVWDKNPFSSYVLKGNERVISYTVSTKTIPNLHMSKSMFGHRLISEAEPIVSGQVVHSGNLFSGEVTYFRIYAVGSVIDDLEIGWSFRSYDEYSDSWKLSGGFTTRAIELNMTVN